jgi:acetolactate synthase regulatory subunit
MVEQNVALHIVPSNFEDASAAIEKLATAHGGYVANLSASAQTGSARDVNVELRIPAKQAPAFVDAARKLGKVVDESRSSVEVTADYVDLQARLKAAKSAEQRLVELLGNRTGKLSDVLEVERELTRVRSEIESMQGQANVMLHQVAYATVKIELSEEYHVTLQSDGSVWHKLRDAAVSGFRNLEESIVGALVFLLDAGLSILFWGAVIFGAAWLVRRKIRARRTPSTSAV